MKNNKKTVNADYQAAITQRYIDRLEEIIANEEKGLSWEKPFFSCNEIPFNASTGQKYRGANIVSLISEEYADPRWMTFQQMKDMSAKTNTELHLKKGSSASYVMKVVPVYEKDEKGNIIKDAAGTAVQKTYADGTPQVGYKYFPVFNCSQIEGMAPYVKLERPAFTIEQDVADLQTALEKRTGLVVEHSFRTQPYYSPSQHRVHMPEPELFHTETAYYDTLLHEFGHSTGTALGRKMEGKFGSAEYAKEELVAELSSSFMSMEMGLPHNLASHENHVMYLKSWLQCLKDDTTFISRAANQAGKAAEYQLEHLREYRLELQNSGQLMKEEAAIEAFEALGMTRSDAQGVYDIQKGYPVMEVDPNPTPTNIEAAKTNVRDVVREALWRNPHWEPSLDDLDHAAKDPSPVVREQVDKRTKEMDVSAFNVGNLDGFSL